MDREATSSKLVRLESLASLMCSLFLNLILNLYLKEVHL